MLDIIELLPELQLSSRGTRGENLFQIFTGLLRRLSISDMAEQLVSDTRCEVVHYLACRLFPSRRVPMCRLRRFIISSVNLTLVEMPEQVLMHLIRQRCVLASFPLLPRERASHSSVHFFLFLSFCSSPEIRVFPLRVDVGSRGSQPSRSDTMKRVSCGSYTETSYRTQVQWKA